MYKMQNYFCVKILVNNFESLDFTEQIIDIKTQFGNTIYKIGQTRYENVAGG